MDGIFDDDVVNEGFQSVVDEKARLLAAQGLSETEIEQRIAEIVPEALAAASEPIKERLRADGPRLVLENQTVRQEFEGRLVHRWLDALTHYEMILRIAEEAGSDFHLKGEVSKEEHFLYQALRSLHARACLTASEVLALLRSGHPFGAHARWRTLHELAVVSYVLTSKDAPADIAERFFLHSAVQRAKDAVEYQEHAEALNYSPLPEDEFRELLVERDEVVARFGKNFDFTYGWASVLFDGKRPTFRDLEKLASLEHLRPHYSWASHRVHATAKGADLNVVTRGPFSTYLAGPTNHHLADPAQSALISLHQVTTNFLMHGRPNMEKEPFRIVIPGIIHDFLQEACEAFIAVHREIEAEEQELWSDLDQDSEVGKGD